MSSLTKPTRVPPAAALADDEDEGTASAPSAMDLEHVPCPLCGADDAETVFRRPDWRFLVSDFAFPVVRCRRCTLVYVTPRPTERAIHAYYTPDFYVPAATPEEALREHGRALEARYRRVRHLPPGRLLDIGCYRGEFLHFMQEKGWETKGVEFSSKPPNLFEQDIFYGTIDEAALPAASFDLVTLWAVFEHVLHPRQVLAQVRRVLKPGGRLVMLVPNFRSLPGRYMQHDDVPRHVTMFTIRTLSEMLRLEGFTPRGYHFSQDIYSGSTRGILNYLFKRLHGEPLAEIIAQNRTDGRWLEFAQELRGRGSAWMLRIDRLDIAVTPLLDRLLDTLHLGFIMTSESERDPDRPA